MCIRDECHTHDTTHHAKAAYQISNHSHGPFPSMVILHPVYKLFLLQKCYKINAKFLYWNTCIPLTTFVFQKQYYPHFFQDLHAKLHLVVHWRPMGGLGLFCTLSLGCCLCHIFRFHYLFYKQWHKY
jgi:hypothetical protein